MKAFGKIEIKASGLLKIAVILFIGVMVLYIWYAQVYKPNQETIEEKTATLTQLRAKLQRAKATLANETKLRWELERLFAQYKLVEELMPAERDIPNFISKIYLAAKQADVSIIRIEPRPSVPQTYYIVDPYALQIKTTFAGLGKFLALISNLPFTALVDELKITRSGQGENQIEVTMIVNTHHMTAAQRITRIEEVTKKAQKRGKRRPKRSTPKPPTPPKPKPPA